MLKILGSIMVVTILTGGYLVAKQTTQNIKSTDDEDVAKLAALEAQLETTTPEVNTTAVAADVTTETNLSSTPETAPLAADVANSANPGAAQPRTEAQLQEEHAALSAQFSELQAQVVARNRQDPIPYIDFVRPTGFVNSEPFTLADLVGEKVILMKFTTYSCINCQRTYPYLIDWHNSYADEGLAVVFVHTPEFSFEHDIANVRTAMKKEGITFPVVLDNNKETWRAYGNRFWPRQYLIDINGDIVYDHIGEGAYTITETMIQALLAERAQKRGTS